MANRFYSTILGQILSPTYRKVFPSYDWDEDVWRVNQIMNLPKIVGREDIGFMKNVPNEEVKRNDNAIRKWIDEQMVGCSCLVVFFGEKTYQSNWVLYEMMQAGIRNMGRLLINLEGMKNQKGTPCAYGIDPYAAHGLYTQKDGAYIIRQYHWINDDGIDNIGEWINDACIRVGR